METTKKINLNLNGQRVEFIVSVENTYDNNFNFKVEDINDGGIVFKGFIFNKRYEIADSSSSIMYFRNVIESKVKTEIRKMAKSLNKNVNI